MRAHPPLPADPAAPAAAAPATPAPIINYGSPTIPFTEGDAPGQSSQPFTGEAPFLPPSFNPVNGSMVGLPAPIYINFQRPIANRQMAQDADSDHLEPAGGEAASTGSPTRSCAGARRTSGRPTPW